MKDFTEIAVRSTVDGSKEPSLLYIPETAHEKTVPLVVGLHTWSYDRFNKMDAYLPFCKSRGWALLLPEFRGPNLRTNPRGPEACGSLCAISDILDAVNFVMETGYADFSRIFLLGASGGGHAALLTAARSPLFWRGVAVWCPVSDLTSWHAYYGAGNSYASELEYCLGGTPAERPDLYFSRSPLTYAKALSTVCLSIHQGRRDEIVPWKMNRDLHEAIEAFSPEHCYFDLFDGAHDEDISRSFAWFDSLCSKKLHHSTITG